MVHRRWLAAGALVVVVISLGVGLGIGSESIAVQMRLASLQLDEFRENLWFVSVPPMLELEPWTGVGANMFDQLSMRYRGTGFTNLPVHAHNEWLQLRIEYGRLGLLLGAVFFAVHIAAGWRNALRMAREAGAMALLPQGTTLGLCVGALGAFAAQGMHAVFDYGLHVPAVALLSALGAGWLAGAGGFRLAPASDAGVAGWPSCRLWLVRAGVDGGPGRSCGTQGPEVGERPA